ncbi:MAG: hypothetical protein ACYDCK_04990 [Thermoplasmatota archaeon]
MNGDAPRRRGPPLLLVALAVATLASLALDFLARARGGLTGFPARFAATWPVLLGATLAGVALLVVLRVAAAALTRRGATRADSAMRPLETLGTLAIVIVAVASLTGEAGSALVSLGLIGFGVSLALQRPLLALAGWVNIRAGRLVREGDRIEIMGVVGDVLEIGLFTTRVWEIGSAASPVAAGASVTLGRPTGRIVALSNASFLEHPLANATHDSAHVFDEFAVTVAYEGDLELARRLLRACGEEVLDRGAHEAAAVAYRRLTRGMPIETNFPAEPVILEALQDSWIELRLRYLVDVRNRAGVRTALARAWLAATAPHARELPNVYPRVQPQAVGADGRPTPAVADAPR